MLQDMQRAASFDRSRTYRYALQRTWDARDERIAFVMLNPSTADETGDDPTIRRCIGFARTWGYGSLVVVNLFAYRTSSPALLARAGQPVGPRNNYYLRRAAKESAAIVAAWGAHGGLHGREREVTGLLAPWRLWCLGITAKGQPRHPLYVRANTELRPLAR